MLPHRLARLSRLTQGLALVGLGLSTPACATPPAKEAAPGDGDLHINAPPTPPTPSATPTGTAASTGTAAPVAEIDAGAGPAVTAPSVPKYVNSLPPAARPGPPDQAPLPDHVNSPPPQKPVLPKRVNSPPSSSK